MTLANWFTLLRLFLAPFILWQFVADSPHSLFWAVFLAVVAGLTDLVDGWVARHFNQVSELGKILDPLSDKTLIIFILLGYSLRWSLPAWMIGIYFVKETLQVIAGGFIFKRQHRMIPSNLWGKTATGCFFLGFVVFLVNAAIGQWIIGFAIGLSIYAFYTYYLTFRKLNAPDQS
jgi:cardiolipin synthase (CMP-forming)